MSEKKWSLVKTEREALANTLAQLGPNQPTLCAGWQTQDLLAHLIIRERRPDAAAALVLPFLENWRTQVESKYAKKDFSELVELFRGGPSTLSPFSIPLIDSLANVIEFAIHNEDARRGQSNWIARSNIAELQDEIKKRLPKFSILALRKSPVGVVMVDENSTQHWLKRGKTVVEIKGEPIEILLYLSGRKAQANVSIHGSPAAIATFDRLELGF